DEPFQEGGHDEDGYETDHQLHTVLAASFQRIQQFMRTGEKDAVAQHETRGTGDDNGRYLQRPVDPYDEHRLPAEPLGKEIILECSDHDAVLQQLPYRTEREEEPGDEDGKGNLDIVQGDPEEHAQPVRLFEDAEGIAARDIVLRHIHILVSQHTPDKGLVMRSRECGDHREQEKNNEGIEYFPVILTDDERQFRLPETRESRYLLALVAVNAQVDARGKTVEVLGHPAMGIKGLGISQVVHEIGELRGHLIRIAGRLILVLLPFIDILLDKETFSHWKNIYL